MNQRFVLGDLERRTLLKLTKEHCNDRRHGCVYTIRFLFKLWPGMGLGCLHICVESKSLVLAIIASSPTTGYGTGNDKTPRFLSKSNTVLRWVLKNT